MIHSFLVAHVGLVLYLLRRDTPLLCSRASSALLKSVQAIGEHQNNYDNPPQSYMTFLAKRLCEAYDSHGISGCLGVLDDNWVFLNEASASSCVFSQNLVQTIFDECDCSITHKKKYVKGKITGIFNALVGSCSLRSISASRTCNTDEINNTFAADFALKLLNAYDKLDVFSHWRPDIVTLSLVYSALCDVYPEKASEILQRGQQLNPSSSQESIATQSLVVDDWEKILYHNHGIEILYDSLDILIVNKPSGMSLLCIENALMDQGVPLSDLNPDGSRGFVHRLDVGTSGCLVLAKTNAMAAILISHFFLRLVDKSYLALVCNPLSQPGVANETLPWTGAIQHPIDGRPAESYYEIIDHCHGTSGFSSLTSLLRIKTRQGRKHQVRIHCSRGLHRPIVLDHRYGGERIMFLVKATSLQQARSKKRICLHADRLSFTAMGIAAEAPLPAWWEDIRCDINNWQ
jgi:23S rRNA pseudouridine1911/1915/1917 synthase